MGTNCTSYICFIAGCRPYTHSLASEHHLFPLPFPFSLGHHSHTFPSAMLQSANTSRGELEHESGGGVMAWERGGLRSQVTQERNNQKQFLAGYHPQGTTQIAHSDTLLVSLRGLFACSGALARGAVFKSASQLEANKVLSGNAGGMPSWCSPSALLQLTVYLPDRDLYTCLEPGFL